ncbi:MAG: hypothetical protein Q8W44_03275 [Candidatus Palauibacterales bacterium]|nr:hypothetical protein [Candidatus Palauibacterales bacterium]
MQKASPHARGSGFIAVALALALGLALPGTARAQSTTYTACYVPDAGAVYMIGQQDTPSSCLESSHVEFTFGGDTTGVSDHGNLSGLMDDDHPQYVLDRDSILSVDSTGNFVGVNRSDPITGADVFTVHSDATSDGIYGGMYVNTAGSGAWPFYGYATGGSSTMWTYYDGGTESWHVYNRDERLTVGSDGNVGIGTTGSSSRLAVLNSTDAGYAGEFVVDNSSNPNKALYAETVGSGEALRVNVASSTNSNDALFVRHRGTGPLITAMTASSSATNIRFRVDNDGNVTADGTISGGGADVAEAFDVEGRAESYEPGDVLVVSTEEDRTVTRSSTARSSRVVGVYATKPGVLLSERGTETDLESQVPMGVVGVIPTKVSAENGSIQRGDLLVTAETPGHAMKAEPEVIEGMEIYPQGAVIGKALEAFDGPGTGTIEVMVNVK